MAKWVTVFGGYAQKNAGLQEGTLSNDRMDPNFGPLNSWPMA